MTSTAKSDIILKQSRNTAMRVCWNRQTGTFEGRVSTDVWVQVPLLAPRSRFRKLNRDFLFISMQNKKLFSVYNEDSFLHKYIITWALVLGKVPHHCARSHDFPKICAVYHVETSKYTLTFAQFCDIIRKMLNHHTNSQMVNFLTRRDKK